MSQFLLLVGPRLTAVNEGVVLRSLREASPFVRRVAARLLSASEQTQCWYPEPAEGGSTDHLFTEAQAALQGGRSLGATRLGQLLHRALPACTRILAWCAGDWQDLDRAGSEAWAHALLAQQLVDGPGEVYLDFARVAEGGHALRRQ